MGVRTDIERSWDESLHYVHGGVDITVLTLPLVFVLERPGLSLYRRSPASGSRALSKATLLDLTTLQEPIQCRMYRSRIQTIERSMQHRCRFKREGTYRSSCSIRRRKVHLVLRVQDRSAEEREILITWQGEIVFCASSSCSNAYHASGRFRDDFLTSRLLYTTLL